ncbi:MAG: ABC-2 family transporter protein [archaeon]
MKTLRFFLKSFMMTLSASMTFRFNFILRTITLLSFDLVMPFVTLLIYMNTNGFPGWTFNQILLFQGIYLSINAIDRLFFQSVDWSLSHEIRSGDFDRVLLYPVDVLANLSFNNLNVEHLVNLLIGLAIMGYASVKLNLTLSFFSVGFFLLYFIMALVLIFSLAMLRFSIIIRLVRVGRIGELFMNIRNYGEYPLDIYNPFISGLLRYVIPLAVIAYLPAKSLLGYKPELIPILVVIIIFILTRLLWKSTLKYYTSAGG